MNVILVNFSSSYHRTIAKELIRKGVHVSAIFYIPGYKDPKSVPRDSALTADYEKDSEFLGVRLLSIKEWQYADSIIKWIGKSKNTLSEKLLRDLSYCETVFMRNSDRFAFYPKSTSALRRIYYGYLSGFLDLLEETNPDLLFFSDSPHVAYDTVLFHLAKYKGIKTAILEGTHINNTSILIHDYLKKSTVPEDFLIEKGLNELTELCEKIIPIDSILHPRSLQYIHSRHTDVVGHNRAKRVLKVFCFGCKNIAGLLLNFSGKGYSRALIYNSLRSTRDKSLAKIRYNKKIRKLRKAYDSLCTSDIDQTASFVFFPMHMQPEKTTSAFGGVFEDQILALKILSTSCPVGWKIYVKEHPVQLVPNYIERENYRSIEYYRVLKSIPKVELVPLDASYEDLMQKSRFCATITGSVGWESMLSGRPVIVFGDNWYSSCRGCFHVTSVDECREAIAAMRAISKEEVFSSLLRFIIYYSHSFIDIAANPTRLKLFDKPIKDQITGYVNLIISELNNK